MTLLRAASLALLLAVSCAGAGQRPDAARDASRKLYETAQKSIVTIRLVLKISMGSRDNETKSEAIGTVIDASGLTVVAATAIDPASMFRSAMQSRSSQFKLEVKVNEAALLMPDGTEIEADVVFKDEGLGLAFVRPREVPKELSVVPLQAARPAQVLDEVLLVGRYGRSANRAPWVDQTRVRAIVRGPHPFAICGEEASGAVGTIGYGTDGAPLGIFVGRASTDSEGSGPSRGAMVVLRPLSDLIDATAQAKAAKLPPAATNGN